MGFMLVPFTYGIESLLFSILAVYSTKNQATTYPGRELIHSPDIKLVHRNGRGHAGEEKRSERKGTHFGCFEGVEAVGLELAKRLWGCSSC